VTVISNKKTSEISIISQQPNFMGPVADKWPRMYPSMADGIDEGIPMVADRPDKPRCQDVLDEQNICCVKLT